MRVGIPSRMLRLAISLGVIAGIAVACDRLPHIHVATAALVLLLAILIVASRWGFVEAAAATGMSALFLDYFFLPPRGFGIESPEYWLVYFAFLIVALVTSYAIARAKRLAEEVAVRHRELERLDAFGRNFPIETDPATAMARSLDTLVRTFQIDAAAFCDHSSGKITRSGPQGGAIPVDLLRYAACQAIVSTDKNTGSLMVPIRCGGQPVGSLAVYGDVSALTLRAIADRIEAGLERVRVQERERLAEDTRRGQELKTALLDSLVHEIKTPLSVIKTAISSLLSKDSDAAIRRELLVIADQEADRMDLSISEIFWTARVEAGSVESGKGPHHIRPLIDEVLNELGPLVGQRPVGVEVPDSLPPANCDSHMIKGVLKELLTNAAKYSPSDSPLAISVRQFGNEIITSVKDFGAGIAPGEEKRIFEKHYRGSAQAPGTGLGLAIAKTIVEAHGGRIGAESTPGAGSVLSFSLPVCRRDVA